MTGAMDEERLRDMLDEEQARWLKEHPQAPWWEWPVCMVGAFGFALILFAVAMWIAHKVVYG